MPLFRFPNMPNQTWPPSGSPDLAAVRLTGRPVRLTGLHIACRAPKGPCKPYGGAWTPYGTA
eukprot:4924153-Alexandrium_andersonii.AAC.1